MTCRSRTRGYSGTEYASAIYSRLYRPNGLTRGYISCAGRGGTDLTNTLAPWAGPMIVLADVGRPGITFASGTTWGNDTIQARIESLRAFHGTNYGAKVDKVHFITGSMGALNALNYARTYPTKVKSLALQVPLTDLIDFHDRNVGGWAVEIETAYGGAAGWTAGKVAHNPQSHMAEYASLGIPMKVWYSTNDTFIDPAKAQAFAAGVGCPIQSMGAVDHNPTLYEPINRELLDFFAAND